jgi:YD repeat-containing protein
MNGLRSRCTLAVSNTESPGQCPLPPSFSREPAAEKFLSSTQTTTGAPQPFPFSYTYNLAGDVVTETYPSGRAVTYGHDSADRISSVTGATSSTATNYATSVQYASNGGISQMTLNNNSINGTNMAYTESRTYSPDRQQLTSVSALGTEGDRRGPKGTA